MRMACRRTTSSHSWSYTLKAVECHPQKQLAAIIGFSTIHIKDTTVVRLPQGCSNLDQCTGGALAFQNISNGSWKGLVFIRSMQYDETPTKLRLTSGRLPRFNASFSSSPPCLLGISVPNGVGGSSCEPLSNMCFTHIRLMMLCGLVWGANAKAAVIFILLEFPCTAFFSAVESPSKKL